MIILMRDDNLSWLEIYVNQSLRWVINFLFMYLTIEYMKNKSGLIDFHVTILEGMPEKLNVC